MARILKGAPVAAALTERMAARAAALAIRSWATTAPITPTPIVPPMAATKEKLRSVLKDMGMLKS